jgi:small-conductance mechanosensitive channel
MHASPDTVLWQRSAAIGLALLSLTVPLLAIVVQNIENIASASLTTPDHPGDERLILAALLVGIVSAVGALVVTRTLPPSRFRWLSGAVAALGGLVSAYLIWTLVGSCGLEVIWNVCRP